MDTALWILQGLLAVAFAGAGGMKLAKTRQQLLEDPRMGWAQDVAPAGIKAIGAAELAGALGLVVPAATGILPILTPVAAAGLGFIMLGATAVHLRRKERPAAVATLVFMVLLDAIVVGRIALAG